MKKSPKLVSVIFAVILIVSACSSNSERLSDDKINAVTSFYPLYDFVKKIGGDHVNAINIVEAGQDPHYWTPNADHINTIANADMFVYNGAGFEIWVENQLNNWTKTHIVEASNGIQLLDWNHDHGHSHDEHDHEHSDHDHGQYDPHVWTSPKRAMKLAENIKNGLIYIDSTNLDDYEANYAALIEQLEALDQQLEDIVATGNRDYILVSHNAFAYLAHDYGIRQLSVMGLSPHAEPTAHRIVEIQEFIKAYDVKYILFEELASPQIAEMIAHDLKLEMLVFNPLEGLTQDQKAAGEDYFSIMEKNLTTLQKALH